MTEGDVKVTPFGDLCLLQHAAQSDQGMLWAERIPAEPVMPSWPALKFRSAPAGQSEAAAGGQYCGRRIRQGQSGGRGAYLCSL